VEPPLEESTKLRVFFLVNDSLNRYQLKVRPATSFLSYLPKELLVSSAPKTTRLVLVSLELHDVEVELSKREEVAVIMQEEPALKKAES